MKAEILKLAEECGFMLTHVGKDKTAANYVASKEELLHFADALLELAIETVFAESVDGAVSAEDTAYNLALGHAAVALRALKNEGKDETRN